MPYWQMDVFLLKPDSGFYFELDKRELSTFQIKASPNILPTKSKDCGHNFCPLQSNKKWQQRIEK